MAIKLNSNYVNKFVTEEEVKSYRYMAEFADRMLRDRMGQGSEMGDWVEHPVTYDKEEYARIKKAAADIPSVVGSMLSTGALYAVTALAGAGVGVAGTLVVLKVKKREEEVAAAEQNV